jgi:hypothetical protein
MELAELGDAVHAARHFLAELLADLVQADAVSSTVSWSRPVSRHTRSICMSARIKVTFSG